MRIKIKASVGIKTPAGSIDFGTVHWIDDDKLMLSSPSHLEPGSACELKIELMGAGGWIYTQAHVLQSSDYQSDRNTRAVCHLSALSERDRERLQTYAAVQQNKGAPVTRVPCGIAFGGRSAPPSSSPAIPLRDPLYSISSDDRRLTVRWHDGRAYRRDWALHLALGRLPLTCKTPKGSAFMLRLVLPDGYVATFPAEIRDQTQAGWNAHFFIPLSLRRQMQAYAEGTARRVAK